MRSCLRWPRFGVVGALINTTGTLLVQQLSAKGLIKVQVFPGAHTDKFCIGSNNGFFQWGFSRAGRWGVRRVVLCKAVSAAIRAISDSRVSNARSISRSRFFRRALKSFYPGFHLKLHL